MKNAARPGRLQMLRGMASAQHQLLLWLRVALTQQLTGAVQQLAVVARRRLVDQQLQRLQVAALVQRLTVAMMQQLVAVARRLLVYQQLQRLRVVALAPQLTLAMVQQRVVVTRRGAWYTSNFNGYGW